MKQELENIVANDRRFEERVMAQISPSYRRAHSAILEDGPFEALCSVLMSMTHALSDLLIPVCEYPCLIQKVLPSNSPAQNLAKRIALATDQLCGINQHLIRLCNGPEGTPLTVDLGLLAQSVLADLDQQGEAPTSLHVTLETDGQPALLFGPNDALYHIVRDMCLNAFTSMATGETLTVRIGTMSIRPNTVAYQLGVPAQEYVCAQFQADGPGLDASSGATLFAPFVSTTPGEGFGLGLSSVYRTVLFFNGSILYQPERGFGIDFILLFPKVNA